jgi:hypothetical protein
MYAELRSLTLINNSMLRDVRLSLVFVVVYFPPVIFVLVHFLLVISLVFINAELLSHSLGHPKDGVAVAVAHLTQQELVTSVVLA